MLEDAILRLPAVKAAVGLSKTTIYQRILDGTFPEPIPIDGGRVGWPESVVNEWIAAKKAGIPWRAATKESPAPPPQVVGDPTAVVDRAEVLKSRAKKPRKAKCPEFRLTADPPATLEKPAAKPAIPRERSSRREPARASLQGEFHFD